ncbi:MAG: ATP-binding protein, partial [Myxococcales bacterium]|nr:ATP-binding protein [Myxococcales bacterium]
MNTFQGTKDYVSSPELNQAVACALVLGRPLLVKGEPGTGKTLLAGAISEALERPLFRWHVKSTSKAQEGLYHYDVVARLNDSRFGGGDVHDLRSYIRMGPLGMAFQQTAPAVVLVDEIDKADPEFPNDLLRELDEIAFTITEL